MVRPLNVIVTALELSDSAMMSPIAASVRRRRLARVLKLTSNLVSVLPDETAMPSWSAVEIIEQEKFPRQSLVRGQDDSRSDLGYVVQNALAQCRVAAGINPSSLRGESLRNLLATTTAFPRASAQ